jgi:hypothetical protein
MSNDTCRYIESIKSNIITCKHFIRLSRDRSFVYKQQESLISNQNELNDLKKHFPEYFI